MANNIWGQNRPCFYSVSCNTQGLHFFLSLDHPNNHLENISVFYLLLFNSVTKKYIYCSTQFFKNGVACRTSLICKRTFSIITEYKTYNTTFWKQTAFIFRWFHLKTAQWTTRNCGSYHRRSPSWIIIHYKYLLCTSSTALYSMYSFLSSNILYLSTQYSFNREFNKNYTIF